MDAGGTQKEQSFIAPTVDYEQRSRRSQGFWPCYEPYKYKENNMKFDKRFAEVIVRVYVPIEGDMKDLQNLNLADLLNQAGKTTVHKPANKKKGRKYDR